MASSRSTSRRRIDIAKPLPRTEVKALMLDPSLAEIKELGSRVATLTRTVQQNLGQVIMRARFLGIIVPDRVIELQTRRVYQSHSLSTPSHQNATVSRIIHETTLPVLHLVFVMLPARYILVCRRVCKQFDSTIASKIHWRSRTALTFRDLNAHFERNTTRIFADKYLPRMINVRTVELAFGTFNTASLGPCALLQSLTLRNCFPHIILGEAVYLMSPSYVADTNLYDLNTTNLEQDWKKSMTRYVKQACPHLHELGRLRVEASLLPPYKMAGPSRDGQVISKLFLGWVSSVMELAKTSLHTFEWQLELVEKETSLDVWELRMQNIKSETEYLQSPNSLPVYESEYKETVINFNPLRWDNVRLLVVSSLLNDIALPPSLHNLVLNNGYEQYHYSYGTSPVLLRIPAQCPNLESLSIYQVSVDYQDLKTTLQKLPGLKTFNTDIQLSVFDEEKFGTIDFNTSNPLLENCSWSLPPFVVRDNAQDILLHAHLKRFVMWRWTHDVPHIEKLRQAISKPLLIEFRIKRGGNYNSHLSQLLLPLLDTRLLQILECFSNDINFGPDILALFKYPELTHMVMCGTGSFDFSNIGQNTFPKLTHYYQEASDKAYGTADINKWSRRRIDALGSTLLHYIKAVPTLAYVTLDMTFRDGHAKDDFDMAARPPLLAVLQEMATYFKENSNLLEFALVYFTDGRWPMWIQFVRFATGREFEIRHHVHGVVPQIWPFQYTSSTDPLCETLLHTYETKEQSRLEYDQSVQDDKDDDADVGDVKHGSSHSGNLRARSVHDIGIVPVALGHVTVPGDTMIYNGDTTNYIQVLPNEIFIIRLTSNPSTGYEWRRPRKYKKHVKLPLVTAGLTYLDKEYYTISYDKRPIPAGTGGYDYWAFQADDIRDYKSCRVHLEYSRDWEPDAIETRTFTVIVAAQVASNKTDTTTLPRTSSLPTIHRGKVVSVQHTDRHWIVTLVDENGQEDRIQDYRIAEIHQLSNSASKNQTLSKSNSRLKSKKDNGSIIELAESRQGRVSGALFQNAQVSTDLKRLKPGDQVDIVERTFPDTESFSTMEQGKAVTRTRSWSIQDLVNEHTVQGPSHLARKSSGKSGPSHSRSNGHSSASRDKVGYVMHEFKNHELHSGSHNGPIVKSRAQAIAIALSYKRRGIR